MKRPYLDLEDRMILKNLQNSLSAERLQFDLANKHFRRSFEKTGLYKFAMKIVEFMNSFLQQ